MERTRELYMDINVSGRNFECKNEILTLKPENTVEVLDAFFAESKIEKVYEGKEEIYTVKAGDSLGSIANKKGTTVNAIIASDPNITAQNKGDIKVGQKIKIASQKEKGEKITFKRINKASIGKEVYIIVNTKDFESGTLKINIKQGKEEGIVAQDNVIPVTIEDKRKQTFEVKVGSMSSSDYLNKNDYCDMAIVKITMDPANKEDLKSWNDKLENLEGKKTKLYLLIDAHSGNTDKEVIYHGQNPDKDGKPDTSTKKNYWLDMEGKWFQLKGCLCCNMVVDNDGFITDEKITLKKISELEQGELTKINGIVLHRTVSSDEKSALNSFKSGVGTHFLTLKNGTNFQTASLNKFTYHIGHIKSKAYDNKNSSKEESEKIKNFRKLTPNKNATRAEHDYETKKAYPERYPHNEDSVGIEVVGMPIDKNGKATLIDKEIVGWEAITDEQAKSVSCVVKFLMSEYNLSTNDIYTHEQISRKTSGEGETVLKSIQKFLVIFFVFIALSSCISKNNNDNSFKDKDLKTEFLKEKKEDNLSISFLEFNPEQNLHKIEVEKIRNNVGNIENYNNYKITKKELELTDSLPDTKNNHKEIFFYIKNDTINKIEVKNSHISQFVNNGKIEFSLYIKQVKTFYFIQEEIIFNKDKTISYNIKKENVDFQDIVGWNSADFYWSNNTLLDYVSIGVSQLENDDFDPENYYLEEVQNYKNMLR